jgi:hypothetical protein
MKDEKRIKTFHFLFAPQKGGYSVHFWHIEMRDSLSELIRSHEHPPPPKYFCLSPCNILPPISLLFFFYSADIRAEFLPISSSIYHRSLLSLFYFILPFFIPDCAIFNLLFLLFVYSASIHISKYRQPSFATVLQRDPLYTYITTCFELIQSHHQVLSHTKKKLHGLSPQANYTDRATSACRRSDCQLLRIERAMWSA